MDVFFRSLRVKYKNIRILLLYLIVSTLFNMSDALGNQALLDDLFDVSFPTESEGWACGRWGTVLHTSDGGKTWYRQETNTDKTLASIYFIDTRNGWCVGNSGTIIRTKDGGENWYRQKAPLVTFEGTSGWFGEGGTCKIENEPLQTFLMGVHFASKELGWIVTERMLILNTTDGGEEWTVQFCGQDFIFQDVSFCDDKNGWAVGEYGFIYHTADGGKKWDKQAGMLDFSEETGDIIGGNYLFGVKAVSHSTAWAGGIDGYIVKTKDAGATWKQVKGLPKTHLFGITVDKKDNVVICGRSTLLISSDGGKRFLIADTKPPVTYGWLFGTANRKGAGFVAVGKSQSVYLSENDLESWLIAKTN